VSRLLLVACFSLSACPSNVAPVADPGSLQKTDIVDAVAHHAVCNDGSPAAYYFQQGSGSSIHDWVLHFEGGGRCASVVECNDHAAQHTSSVDWEPSLLGEGILSDIYSENPYFYQSNHVFLRQCSSDGWLGTQKVGIGWNAYEFRGSLIFKRVMTDLINNHVMDQAQNVLLSGASSGTQGVYQHLDWLASLLPQAQVKGVVDAGYFLNIQSYDSSIDSVQVLARKYEESHGSYLDAGCQLAYAETPSFCLLAETVTPYITTPLMVKQAQNDSVVFEKYGLFKPYDNQGLVYISNYVERLRSSLLGQPMVYADAGSEHTTIAGKRFPRERIGQVYFHDFLGQWFYQGNNPGSIIE